MANTSTFALNQKINQLQAQVNGIITDLIPYPIGDVARLNVAQDWSAIQTFNVLPETAIAPTTDDQLANKKYVDDEIALVGLQQVLTADNVSDLSIILQDTLVAPTTTSTLNENSLIFVDTSNPPFTKNLNIDNANNIVSVFNTNTTTGAFASGAVGVGGIDINQDDGTGVGNNITISSKEMEYFETGTSFPFFAFRYSGSTTFRYDLNGIKMGTSGTGVAINTQNIKYPVSYLTASGSVSATSASVRTYNGTNLTATLFTVSATNVGIQFTITNTNATNLTITTFGGTQLIYSTTGVASATSRTLNTGHSQIFTAIQTTASLFGWSMV